MYLPNSFTYFTIYFILLIHCFYMVEIIFDSGSHILWCDR